MTRNSAYEPTYTLSEIAISLTLFVYGCDDYVMLLVMRQIINAQKFSKVIESMLSIMQNPSACESRNDFDRYVGWQLKVLGEGQALYLEHDAEITTLLTYESIMSSHPTNLESDLFDNFITVITILQENSIQLDVNIDAWYPNGDAPNDF